MDPPVTDRSSPAAGPGPGSTACSPPWAPGDPTATPGDPVDHVRRSLAALGYVETSFVEPACRVGVARWDGQVRAFEAGVRMFDVV